MEDDFSLVADGLIKNYDSSYNKNVTNGKSGDRPVKKCGFRDELDKIDENDKVSKSRNKNKKDSKKRSPRKTPRGQVTLNDGDSGIFSCTTSPLSVSPYRQTVNGKDADVSPEVSPRNNVSTTAFSSTPIKNPLYANFSVHRSRQAEDTDFSVNPDPAPYHTSSYMSSTVAKKVPATRRMQDPFAPSPMYSQDINTGQKRGIILHTDRYSWESSRSLEGLSQKQRIDAEMEYLEKARTLQRKRECGHGELELILGGKRISMEERFDLQREIQKLKSLVLPQHARDLYHGKGFKLPSNHSSVKPHKMRLDFNSEPGS